MNIYIKNYYINIIFYKLERKIIYLLLLCFYNKKTKKYSKTTLN